MHKVNGSWSITLLACETALGSDWPETWRSLLAGQNAPLKRYAGQGVMSVTPVIPVPHWRPERQERPPVDLFRTLYRRMIASLSNQSYGQFYLATNHAEADIAVCPPQNNDVRPLTGRLPDEAIPGPAPTLVQSACSSGMTALALAAMASRRTQRPSLILALDTLADIEIIGFKVAGALSPSRARPFSGASDGLSIGEAALALKVAWLPDGAGGTDDPRLLGYGMSCDAHHPTDPDPSGAEIERSWRMAIAMAGLEPEDIDVVFLHGTGTPANDVVEADVCHRIWGTDLPLPVSLKSALGHTMGCSGLLNVAAAHSALQDKRVPPTLAEGSPGKATLPIAITMAASMDAPRYALCVSSGFGGHNMAAVLGIDHDA